MGAAGNLTGSQVRQTRHLTLSTPDPQHLSGLHRLLNQPEVAARWRLGGRSVPLEALPRVLADKVALSLVGHLRDTGELVAYLELVDLDETNQTAQLAVALDPSIQGSGLLLESLAVLIDEAFSRLTLRKIYAMSTDASVDRVASGLAPLERLGIVTREGTLLSHLPLGGKWRDVTVLGIWPDPLRRMIRSGHPLSRLLPDGWRSAA